MRLIVLLLVLMAFGCAAPPTTVEEPASGERWEWRPLREGEVDDNGWRTPDSLVYRYGADGRLISRGWYLGGRFPTIEYFDDHGRIRANLSNSLWVVADGSDWQREEFVPELGMNHSRRVYIVGNPHIDDKTVKSLAEVESLRSAIIEDCPHVSAEAIEWLSVELAKRK